MDETDDMKTLAPSILSRRPGLGAKLIQLYGLLNPSQALEVGKQAGFIQGDSGSGGEKK